MHIVRRAIVNTGAMFFSGNVANAATALTLLYIARYLGPEMYGQFAFAIMIITLFEVFAKLGLDDILTRESSKRDENDDKFLNNVISIKVVVAVVVILFANLVVFFLYENVALRFAIAIRSFLLFFSSVSRTLNAIFASKLKMLNPSLIRAGSKFFFPFLAAIVMLNDSSYLFLIAASVVPFVIEAVFLWVVSTSSFLNFKFQISKKVFVFLLRESWPIALLGLVSILYTRTDVVLLSRLVSSEELGFYTAAINIVDGSLSITGSILATAFPLLSRFYKKNQSSFYKTVNKTVKFYRDYSCGCDGNWGCVE